MFVIKIIMNGSDVVHCAWSAESRLICYDIYLLSLTICKIKISIAFCTNSDLKCTYITRCTQCIQGFEIVRSDLALRHDYDSLEL